MDQARPIPAPGSAAGLESAPAVPDYELLRQIGRGSYGEVWLARSKATGALRAAKIVWRHKFEDERPFQREFEGIQKFERISRGHPSQLALFHIGRNDAEGYFYYVMELADSLENPKSEVRNSKQIRSPKSKTPGGGGAVGPSESDFPSALGIATSDSHTPHTLRAELDGGRLPASRVLEIGLALTEALGHLHQHGLVHRDVKPSNVIFVNGRPKLADIGLVTDASDRCSIVGTEGYLPPEGPGTPQADIFALGKVLYEASTGMDRRRFPDLPADMKEWPKPESKLALELNEIIVVACASELSRRYHDIEAMLADLQLLHAGKSVKRNRVWQSYWAASRRAGIALAGLGAIATAVALFLRAPVTPAPNPDGPESTNLLAQADCNRGMAIIRNDEYDRFGAAYTDFTNAIAKDPNFVRPRVGLLEMAIRDTSRLGGSPQDERRKLAKELEHLAPDLPATCVAQAMISFFDWKFEAAEDFALKGIAANPKYEMGHTVYGYMLVCWGRPDEAILQVTNSLKLAPTKAIIYRLTGDAYYAKRDFTNAVEWYDKAIGLDRHAQRSFWSRGRALWANQDYAKALNDFEEANRLSARNESERTALKKRDDDLRMAFNRNGEPGYWEQWQRYAEANPSVPMAWVLIHSPAKRKEALDLLKKAADSGSFQGRESYLNYLLVDSAWDSVRNDTTFKDVLQTIGFTKVMHPRKK